MKLLFILPLPPPVHGSSVVSKAIKDSELINGAFDCRFINSSYSRDMGEIGGLSFKKLWISISIFLETLKALIIFRPGLCYMAPTAKGIGFYKDLPLIALFKLFGRKIVFHLHNKGVALYQDRWLDDKLYRFAFYNTKLILLSERLYDDVKKYVPRENVFICPNGIPYLDTQHDAYNNPVPRLLFLSNLLVSKGVYILLDALKILKDKGYSFICDFVGAETAEIDAVRFEKEVFKRCLNEVVVYKGKQYGEEKNNSLSKSDIFVFPTHNETFGLVLLEAMQYKLPVISTNEGAIPDIVRNGETGFIVEKENTSSLSEAIAKLLDDCGLCKTMGEKGFQHYINNFTLERFEKNCNDIFLKLTFFNRLGGVNLIIYNGNKYDKDKELFFHNADIFVFPTYYQKECFPLVLLEAMQYGLPIVTTGEGGIPDIIDEGKTGYIVKKQHPEALAKGIEKLIQNPVLRKSMGRAGQEKFSKYYTLDIFINRMCGILRQCSGTNI
jgi:glycosyltransferase involved in cell wall biosynthesis